MRIAVITDTHYGVRNDSQYIINHLEKFLVNVFYPYIENNNIRHVIHLGDLVDRRKFINFNTATHVKKFLDNLQRLGTEVFILCGNHDVFYKNTNDINALDILCAEYENVTVVTEPCEVWFTDDGSIGYHSVLLPWINQENQEEAMRLLKGTRAPYCFGHLEISGFEMHKGSFCENGLERSLFDKFDTVLSGHFHHKSTYQNVHYLGSPYQMTWADYGDVKGFHVFDFANLQFIPNPYKLFQKISYDDAGKDLDAVLNFDPTPYAESYIKVVVKSKENPYAFDLFIDKLEKTNPIDIKVVDDHLNLNLEADDDILETAGDTLSVLSEYIDSTQVRPELKTKLETLIKELYIEASIAQ